MSPILVMLTSRSDSDFDVRTSASNKINDIDLSSNALTNPFEGAKEKFYGFRQTA